MHTRHHHAFLAHARLLLLVMQVLLFALPITALATIRQRLNFNSGWLLQVGDVKGAEAADYDDHAWQRVTLPHAWNEAEAFRVPVHQLSDTVMWYRKHFSLHDVADRKFFMELEGVRFGAEVYINGHSLGLTENGVMASGWDLTPFVREGDNVVAVWVNSSWTYRERATNSRYQWNDKNFNANYGGIPKNVWLHTTGKLYQTLPLYSNLGTTGVYVYGKDYDIAGRAVTVHAESEVRNDDAVARSFGYRCTVTDLDGREVARFDGQRHTLQPGSSTTVAAEGRLADAHFWSWGYGYLYTVRTQLLADDGTVIDDHALRTGFRKTAFHDGVTWLNDRAIMMHGYAQRTSNEWPGVGMSVPAWLSDYSNRLMVESGGNLVRWMHVTPWKQDVESCDRVGLIEAMPAGDAERDVDGERWRQRVDLMRDAIIYNRNNPSILFYESGNKGVSEEHMLQMRRLRDLYDPHGGRAAGSREMLDSEAAEYGGEMLYVNKSASKPMWMMEYHRDEGLRKYWDEWSYPYHKEGVGPLYRGAPAPDYNHNMDQFAVGMVTAWHDYYLERPGTGRRVNDGGTKIVFSDTNTHYRGEANYRTSGVVDAMRIPKDAFYAHQVMWDGWVTPERDATHIIGHWNYADGQRLTKYVVSTADSVALWLNGHHLADGVRSHQYLFTFPDISYEAGTLVAVGSRKGQEVSRDTLLTAGTPHHLKVNVMTSPEGFAADGADMALVEYEVVDKEGRRCPLDNRMVHFNLSGEGEWLGGLARPQGDAQLKATANVANGQQGMLDGPETTADFDNYIRSLDLPVECGVNRVLVRSTPQAGTMVLTAAADGLSPVTIEMTTQAVDTCGGVSHRLPQMSLPCNLSRGATPQTPSFTPVYEAVRVAAITTGSNADTRMAAIDDNERSEWKSDGEADNAWATFTLERKACISEIAIKLSGWRNKVYPLAVYEGKRLVWKGLTYPTLGYVHIAVDKPVAANRITIKMLAPSRDSNAFGDVKELAGGNANELDRFVAAKGKTELRIVEVDFLEHKQ
jgi:beta-galactosidase